MSFKKYLKGFTPYKIVSLVAIFSGVIVLTASVAHKKWDNFDMVFYGKHVVAHQNLWDLTVDHDDFNFGNNVGSFSSPKKNPKQFEWRTQIRYLLASAVGIGFLGFVSLLLAALFQRPIVHVICRSIGLLTVQCASYMVAVGTMLYKYQFQDILTIPMKDPVNKIPIDEYVLADGWYIAWAAVGLYIFGTSVNVFELTVKSIKSGNANSVEGSVGTTGNKATQGILTVSSVESGDVGEKKKKHVITSVQQAPTDTKEKAKSNQK